jgi:curved DNA-binding protein CbpA
MATSAHPDYSFEVAPTVDITRLPLTQEEGVVVARMLGRRVTVQELVRESVLPAQTAEAIVESLVKKGAVVRIGGSRMPAGLDPYANLLFSAADLAEPVDLTEDQKKRILFVEMHLGKWSHYKLLGLKRTSTPAEIKGGYFRSSKEFHPDAYFRKSLGSYRDRIDRIFRAMKAAYDVLADPQKREEYNASAVLELTPEEEAELARLAEARKADQAARERDERNAARMKDARLKRNPLAERIKKGRDLFKLAEDARLAGRLEEAANHARIAMSYDESLKARAGPMIQEGERVRGLAMVKKLNQALSSGIDTRALHTELNKLADEAAELATSTADAPLLVECARVLMRLKRPVRSAKLAQQATEVDGRNARAWEALAEAAHADSKWVILLKACDRWLALEPGAARAKELQREAKRYG